MAQPIWQTPAGSLGVIPELQTYTNSVVATDPDSNAVSYRVIAGVLPAGIQFLSTGSLLGIPTVVNEDVTSRFTVRATAGTRIADRTFSITVSGNNVPVWVTPAGTIGNFYTNDEINFKFEWEDNDPGDAVVITLVSGTLPGGLILSPTGLLTGHIQPTANASFLPGQGNSPYDTIPYDLFTAPGGGEITTYEFSLEITDGKVSNLRTFNMTVYPRGILRADTTLITADNTFVTADETPSIAPFLVNTMPSNLGTYRSDNYYAYRFIGENYSNYPINYAISVNSGYGLPPGLYLDTKSGWYYGYIPDQGATEVTYSFNIVVYQSYFEGTPIICTNTTLGTNAITCDSTVQIETGQPLIFAGTGFGGITASPLQVYYVDTVLSDTEFTVSLLPGSGIPVVLSASSGSMTANLIVASEPYPFTLSLTGAVDAEVTWITDSDLGTINNGSTSLLKIEAVNRGGRTLAYRLKSGAYNLLPQGLELLPSGDIAGRVSFDTFSLDLGATTFDQSFAINRNVSTLGTTFDSVYEFTVNAYAPELVTPIYKVKSVTVVNGGTGFNSFTPPILTFSTPIGATAVIAQVSVVNISGGAIASVDILDPGDGYTMANPATLTVTEGFGGSGAEFEVVMELSGSRDVVSVFKTFTVRVLRKYDVPCQNLLINALPPQNDRVMIAGLLSNTEIFRPEWIYRPTDPNFGVAKNVSYAHAFGLLPAAMEAYVSSLYLNHYWKNLVLGEIKTARALDADGNVVYEVVYSQIVDNLVNNQGESVGKIVNLPYPITLPDDTSTQQVYPNSLDNMRDQVIDVVGQISNNVPMPLWMVSKQSDGSVLGYTPAWVLAYTLPGRSNEIVYYFNQLFTGSLNTVDFKVDRYVLDSSLSHNWNPTGTYISGNNADPVNDIVVGPGIWDPHPATMTTFDLSSGNETVFDQDSLQFIDPVDTYSVFDPDTGTLLPVTDEYDKYLVFPKTNILV